VAVNSPKNIGRAAKAIKKAFQVQLDGLGFALVEVLSMCPTNWKMSPVTSAKWIDETMSQVFPLGVIKDETGYQAKEGKAS
jgi:2-oxoglutarate ferredoxin oxidoreductase subunit beta